MFGTPENILPVSFREKVFTTCISLSAIQVSKGLILIVDTLVNTLYYSFKIFPQF